MICCREGPNPTDRPAAARAAPAAAAAADERQQREEEDARWEADHQRQREAENQKILELPELAGAGAGTEGKIHRVGPKLAS